MSSFCLKFLEILLCCQRIINHLTLYLSQVKQDHLGNETPKATLLLFTSVVIPELKVVSTDPLPPGNAI